MDSMREFANLEYRGEGNCAIVLASKKTKQVYRLVKCKATQKIKKKLERNSDCGLSNSDAKSIQSAIRAELDDVISYMNNVIKPLMSEQYVVTPSVTTIPKSFGEKSVALVSDARPAHRRKSQCDIVDPDVRSALVLPDFCFVYHPKTQTSTTEPILEQFSDLSHRGIQSGHVCLTITDRSASEHGSCCSSESDSFGSSHTDLSCSSQRKDSLEEEDDDAGDEVDGDLCVRNQDGHFNDVSDSQQCVHKAHNGGGGYVQPYICNKASPFSPNGYRKGVGTDCCVMQDRRVGGEGFISDFLRSPSMPSQNDQGVNDSQFTISIEIKPKKGFILRHPHGESSGGMEQVCRFCMHQILKRKSGQWPQTSSYCPLDLFSGNRQRMKHALFSLIKTPQNNLKICRNG
ncbi:uncharacterized protein LOC101848860, partial [Aplysia californica]|uniref:Inositol-pentakisphosphate 2-kinase n=1 Tax=Aplysia californica TaxID=6500 RepID=A0ABM1ADM1_APLCA